MTTRAEMLYADCVRFIESMGWRRIEPGSAWWWHKRDGEEFFGEVVAIALESAGLDLRDEPSALDAADADLAAGETVTVSEALDGDA